MQAWHEVNKALLDLRLVIFVGNVRLWETWFRLMSEPPRVQSPPVPQKRTRPQLVAIAGMRRDHIFAGDPPGFGKL